MKCEAFGRCGSCSLYEFSYKEQLDKKLSFIQNQFCNFYRGDIELFTSLKSAYRNRAEFRVWHDGKELTYAMSGFDKKEIVFINECKIVCQKIQYLMPLLIKSIKANYILREKLFGVEFVSFDDEVLVILLYHKKIDKEWQKEALKLRDKLSANIIGRSRGVRIVIKDDFIFMKLNVQDKEYIYKVYENSFVQPNTKVNEKMISWVKTNSKSFGKDLLELYCGLGNFTLPLSENFSKVLATEISKSSIKSAKENCKLNKITNISFVRLSTNELVQALRKERIFRRLEGIELEGYDFSTIFIDPPRAGVDDDSLKFVSTFENIIYISCNPQTLKRDMQLLSKSHKVTKFAIFDQFPYTNHIECGVILKKL